MPPSDIPSFRVSEQNVYVRMVNIDAGYLAEPVLRQVSFEARAGEAALICGPTSAGKTTLMHVLRLVLQPRRGRMQVFGHDVGRLRVAGRAKLKQRIGYIAENPEFVEHWTAFDNIAFPLRMMGRRPQDFEHDIAELIDFVGLTDGGETPVAHMSAAARRLAAIARALAIKPHIILADDPTSGMSPEAGHKIVRRLVEMRRIGAAVVITSQDETLFDVGPSSFWRIDRGHIYLVETGDDDVGDDGGQGDEDVRFGL